jgi:hypothetical protein
MPCRSQRTLDLAGEGNQGQNSAQLIGAVVLPRELAPDRWGEAKLEEALDSKGASLKPKEEERFGGASARPASMSAAARRRTRRKGPSRPRKQRSAAW